jgi:hypothetical protein
MGKMASGTRTAPTINGTGTYKQISVTFVSVIEDTPRSESYILAPGSSDAEIEAFIVALQAESTASIHKVAVSDVYVGLALKSNATADGKPSLDDKLVIRTKNQAHNNIRYVNVPAPIAENFLANSEDVNMDLTENTALQALLTAWDPIDDSYNAQAIFLSERSETNKASLF